MPRRNIIGARRHTYRATRSGVHASLNLAVAASIALVALCAARPGAAQWQPRDTASAAWPASARPVQSTAGWDPFAFPARTVRTYVRPPRRGTAIENLRRYNPILQEAAEFYALPAAFLRAVMHVESHFDPRVVSVDGAMGLMQLMPFTARKMGVVDPYDPRQNIFGGARFLRILANQWQGDLVLTTASYNAGAGAVAKHGGIPPYRETQRYVRRVLGFYEAYRAKAGP